MNFFLPRLRVIFRLLGAGSIKRNTASLQPFILIQCYSEAWCDTYMLPLKHVNTFWFLWGTKENMYFLFKTLFRNYPFILLVEASLLYLSSEKSSTLSSCSHIKSLRNLLKHTTVPLLSTHTGRHEGKQGTMSRMQIPSKCTARMWSEHIPSTSQFSLTHKRQFWWGFLLFTKILIQDLVCLTFTFHVMTLPSHPCETHFSMPWGLVLYFIAWRSTNINN